MKRTAMIVALALLGAMLFAQDVELDKGIPQAAAAVTKKLTPRIKIAVLDIAAGTKDMSSYLSDELVAALVNDGRFTIVDRSNLEAIRGELNFQMGGEVNEESAQSMGAMLGAEVVITGSFKDDGEAYRFRITALKVETAEILGVSTLRITPTNKTQALLGKKPITKVSAKPKKEAKPVGKGAAAAINPLFGLGSYLQGDTAGGILVTALEAACAGAVAYGFLAPRENVEEFDAATSMVTTGTRFTALAKYCVIGGAAGFGATALFAIVKPLIYKAPVKAALAPAFDLALLPDRSVTLSFTVPLR